MAALDLGIESQQRERSRAEALAGYDETGKVRKPSSAGAMSARHFRVLALETRGVFCCDLSVRPLRENRLLQGESTQMAARSGSITQPRTSHGPWRIQWH